MRWSKLRQILAKILRSKRWWEHFMGDCLLHQSSHVTHVPRSNGSRVRDQRVDPASNLRHCEERCAGGECAGHDCRTESCIALHLWMTCLCWNGPLMRMHWLFQFVLCGPDGPTWPSISNTYRDLSPRCESFQSTSQRKRDELVRMAADIFVQTGKTAGSLDESDWNSWNILTHIHSHWIKCNHIKTWL